MLDSHYEFTCTLELVFFFFFSLRTAFVMYSFFLAFIIPAVVSSLQLTRTSRSDTGGFSQVTTGHFLHRILGGISHKSNTPVHVEYECTTATVMTYIFIYAGISPDTDLGNLLPWKKKKEFWSHQILPHLNPLEFHICKTLMLKTGKKVLLKLMYFSKAGVLFTKKIER